MSKPVGPYSPFVKAGSFIYTSGQIGATNGVVAGGGVEAELEVALQNLESVLESAGVDKSQVVKTTVFLTDMGDYDKLNEIYNLFFDQGKPARSAVAVAALPLGALVEIEAVAYID